MGQHHVVVKLVLDLFMGQHVVVKHDHCSAVWVATTWTLMTVAVDRQTVGSRCSTSATGSRMDLKLPCIMEVLWANLKHPMLWVVLRTDLELVDDAERVVLGRRQRPQDGQRRAEGPWRRQERCRTLSVTKTAVVCSAEGSLMTRWH